MPDKNPSGARSGARDRKDTTSFGAGGGGGTPAPVAAAPSPVAPSPVAASTSAGGTTLEHVMGRLEAAFDALDRGGRNSVPVWELRSALADVPRPAFDAALRELRVKDTFSMDSHEGRHGPLSRDQIAAGVREAGSLLVYVSRQRD